MAGWVTRLLFIGALLLAIPASAQQPATPAKTMRALDPKLMDSSVDPCVNFYQYACGGWVKQNPIPQDESAYGRFSQLMDENQLVLKAILEKAAAGGSERSPNEQKIGDYYASCMNVEAVNEAGLKPLQPLLDRIAALSSKEELPALTAYLDGIGVTALFSFGSQQDYKDATQQIAMVDQTDLGLPEKGYYERKDDKSVELRNQYVAHVTRIFALLGETKEQAAKDAETVLNLETALASYSLSNVERRDPASLYHMMNLAKFDSSTPSFSFVRFLHDVEALPVDSLNVAEPAYFAGLNQLLASTSLDEWKTYLRWALIHHLPGTALPQALDKESFDFYGKVLDGQPEEKTRWKRCVSATDEALGEALGQVYVEQRFSPKDKQRTLELTRDVEAAMGRDIEQLDWMSAATKARAEEKLHAVANKIGYPDKWRDYSTLMVTRGDAFGNNLRAAAFEEKRDIAKIGKPVDRGEWDMSPPTVNADYSPQMNDINFPAGILQPPFFDRTQDDAVNYGSVGSVIGHELTHGFDDEGRQFDGKGNFADWWTPADSKQFTERADCVVNEFNGFVAVDDLHVNGKLTLGENLADLGGLKLAFLAYLDRAQKAGVDLQQKGSAEYGGLTPHQQFFVAFGQHWCENIRPEDLRLGIETDPHSPAKFRVNGVVTNLPEFQRAFACKTGQPMAPANRCTIW
jgi:endothelin-converting enzyme/putative endopeptidase